MTDDAPAFEIFERAGLESPFRVPGGKLEGQSSLKQLIHSEGDLGKQIRGRLRRHGPLALSPF